MGDDREFLVGGGRVSSCGAFDRKGTSRLKVFAAGTKQANGALVSEEGAAALLQSFCVE